MSEKCTIFVGGEPVSAAVLDMEHIASSVVYGADKGYYLAKYLGIECDVVLGDFDSSPKPERDDVMVFPTKKDDTDLMLAIKHALDAGAKDFQIYGALGGSADHLIGNIQSLSFIVKHGGKAVMTGERDTISLLPPGRYTVPFMQGYSLSLFSYSEKVTHLSITGAEYEASDITLDNGFPLAVSNHVSSPSGAKISFESGELLVIRSKR